MNVRRCVEPAIYNEDRLYEEPIPEFSIEGERDTSINTLLEINRSMDELELGNNEPIENIENIQLQQTFGAVGGVIGDIIADSIPIPGGENVDADAIDPLTDYASCIISKTEPLEFHEVCDDSILQKVANQLEEIDEVVIDDDLTFFVSKEGFAKPLQTTVDSYVKQENDLISGDIPYYNKVNLKMN